MREGLTKSSCAFLMGYSGVKSAEMSQLRKALKQLGAKVYVTRNTLVKRSLKYLERTKLADFVQGPTAFIYSDRDAAAIAKALLKFSQVHESVKLPGGFLSEQILDAQLFKELASLPSREVLYAMLLGTLNSGLNNLLFILHSRVSGLLYILKEIGQMKSRLTEQSERKSAD